MRDPARIPVLLERLRLVWEANPDLRLGQMVANAAGGEDPYPVEDEELVGLIEAAHPAAAGATPDLKIQRTPLGLARKAVDAAKSEIDDALAAWQEAWSASLPDPTGLVERYPFGDFEVELRPDTASLGFEAVFEFSEDPGPDAEVFERKLAAVFEKHGIATVTVLGVNIDSADVEAFNE